MTNLYDEPIEHNEDLYDGSITYSSNVLKNEKSEEDLPLRWKEATTQMDQVFFCLVK